MQPDEINKNNSQPVSVTGNESEIPFEEMHQSDVVFNNEINQEQAQPLYNEMPSFPWYHYGNQSYNEPVYFNPTQVESDFNRPGEAPWNMYSPGICVDQPYPRTRENESGRNGTQREKYNGLVGFLRAMALVIICAFISGAAAYVVMDYRFSRGDFSHTNQVILGSVIPDRQYDDNTGTPIATATDSMSAQDIYDMARTQVVIISTEMPNSFGFPGAPGTTNPVSGSGFIISSDGYILTNFHVIEHAFRNEFPIHVILNDGLSYEAEVIGFEISSDVALIKVDASGLNPVIFGNSSNIRVGQTVYAIGNPFGDLVYSMTDGIVSALDRVVSVEGKSISTFQFSAAVNHGNSGGPIYNTAGEVIGIVTAKVVRGNVEGIGFAIPINDAIEIASELIEHGYISGRPLIGIVGQTVSPGNAEFYDWVVGVYIRSVSHDSAAEAAGLAIGDIITTLGDDEIDSMQDLKFALRNYRAGDTTTITVWRNSEFIDLTITFDEDKYAGQPQINPVPEPESPNPFENIP